MIKKLKTFIHLTPPLRTMVLQAWAYSVYTGFMFAFFKRYAQFGKPLLPGVAASLPNPAKEMSSDNFNRINHITQSIQMAAKYVPWKNVCRHQAYQAKLLCNYYKVPYQVFIGFKKDITTQKIQAHAWTVAGGKIITGFCNPEEYTIQNIYCNT